MGELAEVKIDVFGNAWPTDYEVCSTCGQPDNCGDCNHKELTTQEVRFLGGWVKLESTQKFHQLHYNFVAKRLRNHYPTYRVEDGPTQKLDKAVKLGARGVIEDIALEFAMRFKADNLEFDQYKFLDQCSPDPEKYPLSELWEELS